MYQKEDSAKEYLQHSKKLQFSMSQTLIDNIEIKPTDNVFEIGCGTGKFSANLATAVLKNGKITGCDPEENRIKVAKEKFSDIANLSYVHAGGSQALQNTVKVYDVVFSSNVLHWMSDEELELQGWACRTIEITVTCPPLELTTERQFMAMKPGATAAHMFVMTVPENMAKVVSFTADDLKAKFHDAFRPIPLQKMVKLAQHYGFEVIQAREVLTVTEFASADEYIALLDATLYGKFGCKEIYNKFHDEIKLEMISEDGKLIQSDIMAVVILKKPQTNRSM